MDLIDFRRDMLETVRARAESSNDFNRAGFVDEVGERLSEAEEFIDFEACRFEGVSGKKKLKIDGYSFDEADNSLALLVANFTNEDIMPAFNASDASKAFGMLRAFLEEALRGNLTDGSLEESVPAYGLASDLIGWHGKVTKYRFYLASDAQFKTKAKDWPEESIAGTPTEFHIWDINRFHTAHVSATGRDELVVEFSEFGDQGLPCLMAAPSGGDYQAYLCMIPGTVLAGIYDRYGSRLLEGNVRSFLSTRGKVNAKIQQTIRNQPEMFFAFNNGIAATAEDVALEQTPSGTRIVSATNLQIVNGGQTTASLAMAGRGTAGKKDGADLSKVMVQMKLSVLPPEKAGDLIPEIARYANSQNKVSDADFFANHPYHIRLEEFSRRLFASPAGGVQHGTHWFYERARGQYVNEQAKLSGAQKRQFELQNPKAQLLTKTDVAKLENTWRGMPNKVSMGAQKNFLLFADSIAKSWADDEKQFNEDYFRNLIALAILFRHTESLVKRQDWYQGGYRANIVTYTLSKLHDMVAEQALGKQIDLRAIWDRQSVPPPLADQITVIAKRVFEMLTDPNRPKDNVTEWAKMQACWDQIKSSEIRLSSAFLASLQDLRVVRDAAKKAKEIQKTDNGIATQVAVLEVPGSKWAHMRAWAEANKLLTPTQSDLLQLASKIPFKLPTEKQCTLIWQLHEKMIDEGYVN
ncbi:AIPR family protein [Lacisediminimonas profundi]|uniref:AIPR family protein n=1 Tax=Lacisediminimonas profundi TaxID=2603856 RepID=UPI00124B26E0|nr:AIPR family protein [Lacisediminimonas profundi]